jgi:hypothetical protein
MAPCQPGNVTTRLVLRVTCPRCLTLMLGPAFADLIGAIEALRAWRRADDQPAA